MPKLKSHRGAKKRFKVSSTGKIRGRKAMGRHILTKKSRKNKRPKKNSFELAPGDKKLVKHLIAC